MEREQLELKIASSLSDANSYVEQAAFEATVYGSDVVQASRLEEAMRGVGEIYVGTLPWIREQGSSRPAPQESEKRKEAAELNKLLEDAMDTFADLLDEPAHRGVGQERISNLLESVDLARKKSDRASLKELSRAMTQFSLSMGAR